MTEVERHWEPVPPKLRTFAFDGTNLAECLAWINQFPQGCAAGIGGADWVRDDTIIGLPLTGGTVRIGSTRETEFGSGAAFDWHIGWVCVALNTQSFGMPGALAEQTAGWAEVTE
jgi:hypothetical protein